MFSLSIFPEGERDPYGGEWELHESKGDSRQIIALYHVVAIKQRESPCYERYIMAASSQLVESNLNPT